MINLRPDEPIYLQIAGYLREEIRSGRLRPGQVVPSERTLTQEFGVARETARKAHQLLRAEGLIERSRGQALTVRELTEIQDLTPPPGAVVTARMPSAQERNEMGLVEGVPLFVVTSDDGSAEVFPADRWRLRWPSD